MVAQRAVKTVGRLPSKGRGWKTVWLGKRDKMMQLPSKNVLTLDVLIAQGFTREQDNMDL